MRLGLASPRRKRSNSGRPRQAVHKSHSAQAQGVSNRTSQQGVFSVQPQRLQARTLPRGYWVAGFKSEPEANRMASNGGFCPSLASMLPAGWFITPPRRRPRYLPWAGSVVPSHRFCRAQQPPHSLLERPHSAGPHLERGQIVNPGEPPSGASPCDCPTQLWDI